MAKGAKERNIKATSDAIRKVLEETMEGEYSVELEKLLHDLKERPAQLLKASNKTAERAQNLRAPERAIWFEKLEEYSAEQREKLHDLIHKND